MLLSTDTQGSRRAILVMSALFLSVFLLAAALPNAHAVDSNEDANARQEIEYLLHYIAASEATFTRNGTDHTAKDAAEHLAMKYRRAGRYATTAENFIDNLASQSSITRKPYSVVTADGQQLTARDWLYAALKEYRQRNNQ